MNTSRTVTVFGAYGHTGRFVVAELLDRGLTPLLVGRDAGRLAAFAARHPGCEARPASADDPAALDRALSGAAAVINCAGPFAMTAAPVLEAALRAGIPYVDVTGEVEAAADTFAAFADRAAAARCPVVPAMAFFGGLGDLLVTAAAGDWAAADEVCLAYALSDWRPTSGTRASSRVSRQRRDGRRPVHTDGGLRYRTGEAPTGRWSFPPPVGEQTVLMECTTADSITVPRHLKVPAIHSCMTVDAIREVLDPEAPLPRAVDDRGRSAQTFLVEAVVRAGGRERRAVARGQDIYAVSAPLAVEAVQRMLDGRSRVAGIAAPGEMFDAAGFLGSLSGHLSVELP
ncbi:saccharopine dehydrogenase NADP-binding domain-containing protein [Streptomyces sp. NPDC052396]|uniref:saccharopine dehydrogenase NADP-binding domain-containing protein n=1 Tax=Streptomyces sp. NPDC052396 TaxID=3365689 RepID=UPI0037D2C65E